MVIAHGWADDPGRGWIAWLVRELRALGIDTVAPRFPDPKVPQIPAWIETLKTAVGELDEGLVLVGHSLGCPVIIRFLEQQQGQIAGLVLVAGFAQTAHQRPNPLFDPPLNLAKVKSMAKQRICIYSDDDQSVDPTRSKELAAGLDAELILDAGKGHFAGLHGIDTLPSALEAVLSCYN